MMMIRWLTILILILAGLYSGYWYLGARAVEAGAQNALQGLADDGWDIAGTRASTRGFPSRFDTTLEDVDLTAPDGTLRYQTPFAQVFALSYRPNHLIMAMAPTQVLELAGQRMTMETDGLRASAMLAAATDLRLETFTAEASLLGFSSSLGFSVTAEDLLLALRPAGPAPMRYDAFLSVKEVDLPRTTVDQRPISSLSLDAGLVLTRSLDRHLMTGPAPQIDQIDVKSLSMDWAGAQLGGSGLLSVSPEGALTGEITLTIANHGELIRQLSYVGAIDPGVAPTWIKMGDAMASGQDSLDLPLTFANGYMSLGPFPMGPAPRLR